MTPLRTDPSNLGGRALVENLPSHRRRWLRWLIGAVDPPFQHCPFDAFSGPDVLRQRAKQRQPGRRSRILNLQQVIHFCPPSAQEFRQTTDAIVVCVPKEEPLRLRTPGRHATEANANIFAQLLCCEEPRTDGIYSLPRHIHIILYASRAKTSIEAAVGPKEIFSDFDEDEGSFHGRSERGRNAEEPPGRVSESMEDGGRQHYLSAGAARRIRSARPPSPSRRG